MVQSHTDRSAAKIVMGNQAERVTLRWWGKADCAKDLKNKRQSRAGQ